MPQGSERERGVAIDAGVDPEEHFARTSSPPRTSTGVTHPIFAASVEVLQVDPGADVKIQILRRHRERMAGQGHSPGTAGTELRGVRGTTGWLGAPEDRRRRRNGGRGKGAAL